VQSSIGFEIGFQVDLQVFLNDKLGAHLIIGHDLLDVHNLTVIYKSNKKRSVPDSSLPAELPCIDVYEVNDTLNDYLNNLQIDFNYNEKNQTNQGNKKCCIFIDSDRR